MKKIALFLILILSFSYIFTSYVNGQQTPVLSSSTYFGGSGTFGYDTIRDIYIDNLGNVYITGGTDSIAGLPNNFPITAGSYDTTLNTGTCSTIGSAGALDVFVAKLNSSGQLLWSTYIGGPCYDRAYAIEVDEVTGQVYVAGRAGEGFPTTSGVIQPNFAGDGNANSLYGQQDGFIAKLSADGTQLLWSTYFGGADRSFIRDMDIDDLGNVYVAATNVSQTNPHITAGAFKTTLAPIVDGGVIAKMNSSATSINWATYFGGGGAGTYDLATPSIRVDGLGNVYVLGSTSSPNTPSTNGLDTTLTGLSDMHLVKFNNNGGFIWGTYVGANGPEHTETHGLAIDPQNNPIVASTTESTNFNTLAPYSSVFTQGFQSAYGGSGSSGTGAGTNYSGDGFVIKIAADGTQLLAGTYIGGSAGEGIEGVYSDTSGNIYVSGVTYSPNFPTSADGYDRTLNGNADFFGVKLNSNLNQLIYGTYVGGFSQDFARTSMFNNNIFAIGGEIQSGQSGNPPWPLINALDSVYSGTTEAALVIINFSGVIPPTATSTPVLTPTPTSPAPTASGTTTVTFYPNSADGRIAYFGPGSGTDSGCGLSQWNVGRSSNGSLNTIADSTTSPRSNNPASGCGGVNGAVSIARGFFPFDTSSLPDDAVITSANLYLYVTSRSNQVPDSNSFVAVVQSNQASPTTLTATDFPLVGSTALSNNLTFGSILLNSYNSWQLNASGLNSISKTGYTTLAVREGHDLNDAFVFAGGQTDGIALAMSEQAGTTQDPYLEITYSLPAATATPIPPTPTPTPVVGDANGDGTVNISDFMEWKNQFIAQPQNPTSDFNNDGLINISDFMTWKNAFIASNP